VHGGVVVNSPPSVETRDGGQALALSHFERGGCGAGTKNPFATRNARRRVGVGNKDSPSRISGEGGVVWSGKNHSSKIETEGGRWQWEPFRLNF